MKGKGEAPDEVVIVGAHKREAKNHTVDTRIILHPSHSLIITQSTLA